MKLAALFGGLIFAVIPVHVAAIPAPDTTGLYPHDQSDALRVFASEEGQQAVRDFIHEKSNPTNKGSILMNHADFTGGFVRSIEKDGPEVWKNLNWVICRTKIPHKPNFQFREHYEWRKYDTEFKDVGFHVYWAVAGEFELYGDGGYDNWAFYGSYSRSGPQNKTVTFYNRLM